MPQADAQAFEGEVAVKSESREYYDNEYRPQAGGRFQPPLSSSRLHMVSLFMNAFGSMVYDLSVTRALWPAMCPSGPRLESVCFRLDGFPCRPNVLADLILSPGEREHWRSMRGVEKRRHEWLLGRCAAKGAVRSLLERTSDLHLSPTEIEIVPDPHGRPQVRAGVPFGSVRGWLQPSLSIAHSHGTAVALTVLDPETRVGIDLESLTNRREDFEAIAFSPDERCRLAALPPDLRQEWALRMWCAKEAVGKALGRGLSAGLLAFHVTSAETASGIIEVELRDGALDQFALLQGKSRTSFGTSPRTSGPVGHGNSEVEEAKSRETRALLHNKRLIVYTARESNFVFSAVIYQQGSSPNETGRSHGITWCKKWAS